MMKRYWAMKSDIYGESLRTVGVEAVFLASDVEAELAIKEDTIGVGLKVIALQKEEIARLRKALEPLRDTVDNDYVNEVVDKALEEK